MGVYKSSGGVPNGPEGVQDFCQQGGAHGQRYATEDNPALREKT